jgi:hypothetical protein
MGSTLVEIGADTYPAGARFDAAKHHDASTYQYTPERPEHTVRRGVVEPTPSATPRPWELPQ